MDCSPFFFPPAVHPCSSQTTDGNHTLRLAGHSEPAQEDSGHKLDLPTGVWSCLFQQLNLPSCSPCGFSSASSLSKTPGAPGYIREVTCSPQLQTASLCVILLSLNQILLKICDSLAEISLLSPQAPSMTTYPGQAFITPYRTAALQVSCATYLTHTGCLLLLQKKQLPRE